MDSRLVRRQCASAKLVSVVREPSRISPGIIRRALSSQGHPVGAQILNIKRIGANVRTALATKGALSSDLERARRPIV
jgi:hypothetical protein